MLIIELTRLVSIFRACLWTSFWVKLTKMLDNLILHYGSMHSKIYVSICLGIWVLVNYNLPNHDYTMFQLYYVHTDMCTPIYGRTQLMWVLVPSRLWSNFAWIYCNVVEIYMLTKWDLVSWIWVIVLKESGGSLNNKNFLTNIVALPFIMLERSYICHGLRE